MNLAPRTLTSIAALVGAATLVAAPVAADAAPATSSHAGAHAHVGWNGWRGVHFGDSFSSAHRALGGTLYRGTNDPGGCGDILETSTGTVDAKVGPRAHRVSDFSVKASVAYPLGIRSSQSAVKIRRELKQGGYAVRTVAVDQTGNGDLLEENTAVGPHGHTLYFVSDPGNGKVYRLGLALDRKVAKELMEINGC